MADGPIVYIVERFPERSQTFIQNELRELRGRGVRPIVLALYPHADLDQSASDLPFRRLPSIARRPHLLALAILVALARHPVGFLRASGSILRRPSRLRIHAFGKALLAIAALGTTRPSRVHAHFARASASAALHVAQMTGAAFSFTAHALDIFVRPLDMDRKLDAARPTITVCEYNRRFIEGHWPNRGDIVVIPCGIRIDRMRRSTPYPPDGRRIIAIGRLVPKKGFDDLIRACAILRDRGVSFTCDVIGDGPERAALSAMISESSLADRVQLLGSVPPDHVRDALETATLFCLPAVIAPDGDRDSQPVVIKEALAMEVPVVATAVVGIPEMVDHTVGRLVPPHDPPALASALEELLESDRDVLRDLGTAGRRRVVERFDEAASVEALLTAWKTYGAPVSTSATGRDR